VQRCSTRSWLSAALVTLLLALFIVGDLEAGAGSASAPPERAAGHASTLFADLTVATDFRAGIAPPQRQATRVAERELSLTATPSVADVRGPWWHQAAAVVEPRAGSPAVPQGRAPPTRRATAQSLT
jgi:hypothetical protein